MAYSHTSLAMRDAVSVIGLPVVGVGLSNIYAREPFRRHSLTVEVVAGLISGFDLTRYLLGLCAALALVADHPARHTAARGRQRRRTGT